jgi:hypothetical protein
MAAQLPKLAVLLALTILPACEPASQGTEPSSARSDGTVADTVGETTSAPEIWFEDVAAEVGLHFLHVSGHAESFYMPEIMGAGAALFDADGDGRLDVYCIQGGSLVADPATRPGNQLFLQRGSPPGNRPSDSEAADWHFVDVSEQSGADDRGYGMGATAGDADNDGDIDLYVTNWGPNVLLINDGSGGFLDVGALSGSAHAGWGTSCALLDIEADGDLDLFVVNYLDWTPAGELTCHNELGRRDWCSPQNYESAARDVLLLNLGQARFDDVSDTSGVADLPGTGLGLGCGDFDGDGHVDVFVANDGMPDALWKGDGAGAFEDVALLAGCAVDYSGVSKAGMGVALADVDDDADLDLIVCNLDRQSDSFFVNQGGWFEDETPRMGLGRRSQSFTRFGMGLVDFDADGLLDLFQANGRVTAKAHLHGDDPLAEPDLLQPGRVGSVAAGPKAAAWFGAADTADGSANPAALVGRGAAFGDIDGDGAVDIAIINKDGPLRLLRNVIGPARGHHWLGLSVLDEHGRDALGASVTCRFGERTITRDVRAAYSYLSSNDPRVHFGLGSPAGEAGIAPTAAELSVLWVDGTIEAFGSRALDQYHTLRRGEGR